MVVANKGACIGCKACLRVCTAKGAQTLTSPPDAVAIRRGRP